MAYSPLQLETIQKIVQTVESLEHFCADTKLLLAHATPIQCRVYQIPRTVRENESQPVTDIKPTALLGTEAFNAALHALTDWYGDPQYSTKVVNRVPGALVLANVDESQVLDRIAEINRSKAAIESLIPGLGNRDDRFELLHRHYPWLILAQLTRRLQVLPCSPPLQSCTFTWGIKTEIKKMTADQVCERLESFRQRPRSTIDDVPWDIKIDREIMSIRSLPASAQLRSRRVLRVRPLANLRYHAIDGEPAETYMREAHTPILILNPSRPIKLGALKNYDVQTRSGRQRLKDRGHYERVSDLLPIYLQS
ncbi:MULTISPECIES: DNA replication terminus site-binding protein [unclassified Marinobacter]|jgi:DNA replication terminus site-binding protein|uniref:DNA replication terminus site-binding protein n=1 Tax=unclassified Marinobacter TaxID=83889 RepID=UPI00200FA0F1|nr:MULTISPECIES: DNA replication terminus site-binding protein [unclassified Marinobacter]MCL1476255.1 DNA replication terminus site-binding protein [Marinobacter sp.]MCL1480040.1 DNA replication terminus site-binding protein [Marinobacter sp.]MCL1483013.1 DNA replication terminus site-binding protein [Marinobacter sp.]MCL1488823.1 DNA replication terminus site-binding protein [Marinobacter sp.]UQG58093.1 DNA replication terminus site-binding protein [Marinobacter sp. M4C]